MRTIALSTWHIYLVNLLFMIYQKKLRFEIFTTLYSTSTIVEFLNPLLLFILNFVFGLFRIFIRTKSDRILADFCLVFRILLLFNFKTTPFSIECKPAHHVEVIKERYIRPQQPTNEVFESLKQP
jgi:hypothetical protein